MEKIVSFIILERGIYKFQLLLNHSHQQDLDIYGMDADEFIINFGKHFNVDVSKFMADEYFRPDAFGRSNKKYKELLIKDLIISIEKRVLI